MKPWESLENATGSDGSRFALQRRDAEYVIRVNGQLLMSSQQHHSEEAMAEPLRALKAPAPRVLIGGLGMGFTLRAVLDVLPASGEAVVAELIGQVVEWNRGHLAPLAGRPLDDARTKVVVSDVAALIRERPSAFDAILLDVDNGPFAMSTDRNAWLYAEKGLRSIHRALRPGGVLVVWSGAPDRAFENRAHAEGFNTEALPVSARTGNKGQGHTLFVGWRR